MGRFGQKALQAAMAQRALRARVAAAPRGAH